MRKSYNADDFQELKVAKEFNLIPRPKTKEDLMLAAKENFEKLQTLISKLSGQEQPFLPAPYNWKTYGELNLEFWQKHQNTSLKEATQMFQKSHQDVLDLADTFTNEELFSKNVYKWVGGTVLGSYFVSATSSHCDWAMKKLKAHQKNCKAK